MKKIITFILSLSFALCLVLGLVACDANEPDNSQKEHEHTYGTWIDEVPANCETNGMLGHYHCSGCDKDFDAYKNELTDLVIPSKHNYGTWIDEILATCETKGMLGHYHCSECDKYFDKNKKLLDSIVVNEKHSLGEWNEAVPADCENDGTLGHYTCSQCGNCFDESGNELLDLTIKAQGHSYKDKVCADCGELKASDGLAFSWNIDYASFYVKGIGNCTDTEIVIPAYYNDFPVTYIGSSAFEGNTSITSVRIPDTVTGISSSFKGCTGLAEIIFSENLTSIGANAFNGCTSLTEIYIPNSVTNIGAAAFAGCNGVRRVIMGNGVKTVADSAFMLHNSTEFDGVYISDLSAWCGISFASPSANPLLYSGNLYLNDTLIEGRLVIPAGVESIAGYAFYGWRAITELELPASIQAIGSNAFTECSELDGIYISDLAAYCAISYGSNPLSIAENLYLNEMLVTDLIIPDEVSFIAPYAFFGCTSIKSVTLNATIDKVDSRAFHNCTSLASVIIPNGVNEIGDYAFSGCTALTAVNIPDSVTKLGEYAFSGCTELVSCEIGTGIDVVSAYAFSECARLSLLTLGEGLTKIGGYAFANTAIVFLTIPDSVLEIDAYAFSDNTALISVTLGEKLTTVSKSAFNRCFKLIEIINKSTVSITAGSSVAEHAKVVHNGESVIKNLNGYLFYTQKYITTSAEWLVGYVGNSTELEFPENYGGNHYQVYSYAFANRTDIKRVKLGDGVTAVGENAFANCTLLESVVLGNNLGQIGARAFSGCSALTSMVIPTSLRSVSTNTFSNINSNVIIYYMGDAQSWGTSGISGNSILNNATRYYYSEVQNADGNHWRYVGGVPTPW